jgi:hypothetical protein
MLLVVSGDNLTPGTRELVRFSSPSRIVIISLTTNAAVNVAVVGALVFRSHNDRAWTASNRTEKKR